jgi:hypothetical protein
VRPFVIEVVGLSRVFWGGRPGMRNFPRGGRGAYWLSGVVDDPRLFVWLVRCGRFSWPDYRASSSGWEVGPPAMSCVARPIWFVYWPVRRGWVFDWFVGVVCWVGPSGSWIGPPGLLLVGLSGVC